MADLPRQDWSPEQIADRAELDGTLTVSHTAIYIDRHSGGGLWRHMCCHKLYCKRYGSGCQRRSQVPGRIGIEHHPAKVEHRDRIGHWEAETIHGRRGHGAALSLAERCSCLTRLVKPPRAIVDAVLATMRRRLHPIAHRG